MLLFSKPKAQTAGSKRRLCGPEGPKGLVEMQNRWNAFFSSLGIRASELLAITRKDLQDGVNSGMMHLLQPKTKTRKVVVLTEAAIKDLAALRYDLKLAFPDEKQAFGKSIPKSLKDEGLKRNTNELFKLEKTTQCIYSTSE